MSERINEDWMTEDLGKSLISLPKSSHPSSISDKNGYYNFYVCSSDVQRSFKCEKTEPAVLLSTGGEAAIHYATGKYSYSTDVWATKYSKNLTNEFVFRFIELNISRINNLGFQGSGIKHLDKDYIKKIKITYPPLPEQKKIASILTSVDEVIEKTQLQINKLQDLKKGTMNELLTKGIGHTEFKDSELGRIPNSWEIHSIEELGEIIGGGTPATTEHTYWSGSIMWATPTDVTNLQERYISKTSRTITEEGLRNSSAKLHPSGTILLTSRASIGYPAINLVPMATNQGFQSLQPNDKLNLEFGYQLLLHSRDRLKRLSCGSTFLEISSKEIKKIKLQIPSIPEQKKIASILISIEEDIDKHQKKLHIIQSLKKSLMQDLLTGKVRVAVN